MKTGVGLGSPRQRFAVSTGEPHQVELNDPNRLNALKLTELLDSPPEEAFDRLTRLTTQILGVPVALVSLVDDRRQFFKSQCGLPEPWSSERQTGLSHSFCQHVVIDEKALIVPDAREHPKVCDNLAIRDLQVIAYAGVPLKGHDGSNLGSFCAIDTKPRVWSEQDIEILQDLAAATADEILLRLEVRRRIEAEDQLLKQNSILQESNSEMERLSYILAHDLKAPLRTVTSFTRLLKDHFSDDLDELPEKYMEFITTSTERMNRMVADLTHYARVDGIKVSSAPIPLNKILDTVLDSMHSSISESGVHMEVQDNLPNVLGDSTLLEQSIQNVVANAVKFGSTSVSITATEDGDHCLLSITDNGIGFDPTHKEDVFVLFRRLQSGGDAPGTGTGLAIVRRLLSRMDGSIWADSRKGEGSTFFIKLPISKS